MKEMTKTKEMTYNKKKTSHKRSRTNYNINKKADNNNSYQDDRSHFSFNQFR